MFFFLRHAACVFISACTSVICRIKTSYFLTYLTSHILSTIFADHQRYQLNEEAADLLRVDMAGSAISYHHSAFT